MCIFDLTHGWYMLMLTGVILELVLCIVILGFSYQIQVLRRSCQLFLILACGTLIENVIIPSVTIQVINCIINILQLILVCHDVSCEDKYSHLNPCRSADIKLPIM